MLDALEGTPLWVYGAFLLVWYYGLSARKTNRESLRSLIITPAVLAVWSLFSISYLDRVELAVGSWLVGIMLGSLISLVLFPRRGLAFDEGRRQLIVPGTWKVLGISLLFFAVKYFIGYQAAVHPATSADANMIVLAGVASGFTIGLFCGRAAVFCRALLSLRDNNQSERTI
ncbi:hypothetical protein TX23_18250 [Pseudomonas paralactis]|uniref:DUF1453 domain-containing protein n=1 Tax=Pseudomonas paralactis TaxID=1615673 RepID=A0A0R3AB75_9PSED|nr:DUF6622 family protein [Pseudomonas paralactis]KRP70592.1 hypothetical protein TX23_18250 [Pseudomonas paralactis]